MIKILVIGLGGFIGAIARYGVSSLVRRSAGATFAFGTLTVNTIGCLLIGIIMALAESRQGMPPHLRTFLLIGLLGSFTTFSTFGYETFEYLKVGNLKAGLANIALNVLLGLGAVIAGRWAVKVIMT